MTTTEKELNTQSDSPEMIASAIDRYRGESLSEAQSALYLDTVKDLVRRSAPHSALSALQRLTAACVLLGATAKLGEPFDQVFTEDRAQSWHNAQVAAGKRSKRTSSNDMGRLRALFRVRDGLPATIKAPNVRKAVVAPLLPLLVDALAAAVAGADVAARRGFIAAFGTGMWGPSIAGGCLFRAADGQWWTEWPDGSQRRVVPQFAPLCDSVGADQFTESDTAGLVRVASMQGIALDPKLVRQSWRAAAMAVADPVVVLISTFRLSTGSMSALLPHLDRTVGDTDLKVRFRDGGCAKRAVAVTVAASSPPSEASTGATVTKHSKAAARRRAKEHAQHHEAPAPLAEQLQAELDAYVPATVDAEVWVAIEPTFRWMMERSKLNSVANFAKHRGVLARYLAWRHSSAKSIAVVEAMTFLEIDRYVHSGMDDFDQKTRNDYRTRLRNLAIAVNPGPDATPRIAMGARERLKAPYTPAALAGICRVVRQYGQSAEVRRQLCAVVGLSAGAGLDANDLRYLTRDAIDDRGDDGIFITVSGKRPRRTVVRREFEDLVRIGLEGLPSGGHVFPGKNGRARSTMNGLVEGAAIIEKIEKITPSRLRSTWLAWAMTRDIPFAQLMATSGLTSANSLTDLLAHLSLPTGTDGCGVEALR